MFKRTAPRRFSSFPSKIYLVLGGLILCAAVAHGEEPFKAPGLEIKPNGTFTFHGTVFSTALVCPDYHLEDQRSLKVAPEYPRTDSALWTIKGDVGAGTPNGAFALTETLGTAGPGVDAVHAAYQVEKTDKLPFRSISLLVDIPVSVGSGKTLTVDDTVVELPAEPAKNTLFIRMGVKTIKLPTRDGVLSLESGDGTLTVEIQDKRRWNGDSFRLRLLIAGAHGETAGALALSLNSVPFRGLPISLAQQANRGFRDEAAGDGKGGWTDQGPENDLSSLPPGPLRAGSVPFQVIDPAANGGRSCVVLSGGKPELPRALEIPVAGQQGMTNLYLLHAAAWVPAGQENIGLLHVHYADGSSKKYDVQSQRDVGNWWNATSLPNAVVGWAGRNPSSEVGLFVSHFALDPAKKLAGIHLEAANPALWMVVAMTASPDDIPLAADLPLVVHAGPDWTPYELQYRIEPGSVFDFSSLNDPPAGKYGRLVPTPAGHLEFMDRPGASVRLWGVNLTFGANYLDKEAADSLADQLARSGYNTVRFHHYDGMLVRQGGKSYDLDPTQWDKLDYLFAAMKKRGIYVNIDLFTIRKFTHEEIPELAGDDIGQFKALLPVSDMAFEAWKHFAQNFLAHHNPYTGLTWGMDPALIGICPVNEDPLYITLNKASPGILKTYRDKFEQWAAANHVALTGDATKNAAYNRFLAEMQIQADQRMAGFVRSLDVPTLLTGVNCGTAEALSFPRSRYDYVDNHSYLDHPSFLEKSWNLPMQFRQSDPLQSRAGVIRGLMPGRIFGKPYEVTELHFCWPNRYRSIGGMLSAGYASLQDWDAVYNFDYAGSSANVTSAKEGQMFHLANDPIGLLADRAAAVIFRRGDVQPAPGAVAFSINEATAYEGSWGHPREYPVSDALLGLVTRIGSVTTASDRTLGSEAARRTGVKAVVADGVEPGAGIFPTGADLDRRLMQAGVIPASAVDDSGNRLTSETGQIELSAKPGSMKVVTERCELFALPPGTRSDGRLVSVENGTAFGSLYVVSADGKPLTRSGRVLVSFLTDSLYSGTTFRDDKATILENFGSLPVLVRRGTVRVSLRLPEQANWKAWAVDVNGTRHQPVALERANGACVLTASTTTDGSGCLAWELSRGR